MFRASFMKNIPLFIRNFTENVILCLVAAGVETTSTAFTKKISLHWRERLTNTVHKTYFQNMVCLHFQHVLRHILYTLSCRRQICSPAQSLARRCSC